MKSLQKKKKNKFKMLCVVVKDYYFCTRIRVEVLPQAVHYKNQNKLLKKFKKDLDNKK